MSILVPTQLQHDARYGVQSFMGEIIHHWRKVRQCEPQRHEADGDGDGEADSEDVELRCATSEDAKSDIGDEQGADQWQGELQRVAEQGTSPFRHGAEGMG